MNRNGPWTDVTPITRRQQEKAGELLAVARAALERAAVGDRSA